MVDSLKTSVAQTLFVILSFPPLLSPTSWKWSVMKTFSCFCVSLGLSDTQKVHYTELHYRRNLIKIKTHLKY